MNTRNDVGVVTAAAADDDRLTRRARIVLATVAAEISQGRPEIGQSDIAFRNGRSRAWAAAGVRELQQAGYLICHRAAGPIVGSFELRLPEPEERSRALTNLNSRRKRPRRSPDELPAAKLEALTKAVDRLTRLIERRLPAKGAHR